MKFTEKELNAVETLIEFIGEPLHTPDTEDTPKRVLKAWREYWGAGYHTKVEDIVKTFPDEDKQYDEMVSVINLPVYSTCAHHLAPIIGYATIAYIPNGDLIGLSKFQRILDVYARRLQLQERLTVQVADAFEKLLNPIGVAVHIKAAHLCMSSRGVKVHGAVTSTTALRGLFKDDIKARNEFLQLCSETKMVEV